MKKKHKEDLGLIKCECGYNNKPIYVSVYGSCLRCKRVLDEKAKFKYDMKRKMRLWRNEKW